MSSRCRNNKGNNIYPHKLKVGPGRELETIQDAIDSIDVEDIRGSTILIDRGTTHSSIKLNQVYAGKIVIIGDNRQIVGTSYVNGARKSNYTYLGGDARVARLDNNLKDIGSGEITIIKGIQHKGMHGVNVSIEGDWAGYSKAMNPNFKTLEKGIDYPLHIFQHHQRVRPISKAFHTHIIIIFSFLIQGNHGNYFGMNGFETTIGP